LRAAKVGKQWRINEEDLNNYLESRRTEPVGSEAPVYTPKTKASPGARNRY
jgi:hypothetical protein